MDELVKVLEDLFASTEVKLEDNIFQAGELVDRAETLCSDYLITSDGHCNWTNIELLRAKGYRIFAGDQDNFGWLTGCVQRKGDTRTLVYG